MRLSDENLHEIMAEIGVRFRTFGGGVASEWNPISAALKDRPLQFAAGVDVADVVRLVVNMTNGGANDPHHREE